MGTVKPERPTTDRVDEILKEIDEALEEAAEVRKQPEDPPQ